MKILSSVTMILIAMLLICNGMQAQTRTVGVLLHEAEAADGYTLFAPMPSTTTYLIDNDGRLVHSWEGTARPSFSVYLRENGNLLRTEKIIPPVFDGGGSGGRLLEQDWDGNVTWDYTLGSDTRWPHHDVEPLPNGNVLVIVWEKKTPSEAASMGRDPDLIAFDEWWPDCILELKPVGLHDAEIVWEWHAWDHLIQDYDATKPHYGVVEDHPERIDINYPDGARAARNEDWMHINAIDYHPEFDQILLSVRTFNEIWVIDHSTTTEEAATSTGGRYGKGGDILFRWGNPIAYNMGEPEDRKLFMHHDARWIEKGFPGAGNILIFNNGKQRPVEEYSSIEEIVPPVENDGTYQRTSGEPFGPENITWSYAAPVKTEFFAQNISGAERLLNGNTLICSGPFGTFFEVDVAGTIVWKYISPVTINGPVEQGTDLDIGSQSWENQVFRASRYTANYPGFSGRDLTPGDPIELETTGIEGSSSENPGFMIESIVPNPFAAETMITYRLPRSAHVRLSVHDILGRERVLLTDMVMNAGVHMRHVAATDLTAGTYLLRMEVDDYVITRMMHLVR